MGDDTEPLASPFDVLRHPELRRFMRWYLETRGTRRVVAPAELDPTLFKPLLAHAYYYDHEPAGDAFRLRLAGEEIRELLPNARRGALLEEIIPTAALPLVRERYRRVVHDCAAMHAIGRVFVSMGDPGTGERLVVPLGEEGAKPRQIFGATFYRFARPRTGERRFSHEEMTLSFIPL
ncbi:MAG TPA: PAS domain-containing protein [Stellaceae bacterium]|nr:PAS domain-containing protein [Stellaceae bacterium]